MAMALACALRLLSPRDARVCVQVSEGIDFADDARVGVQVSEGIDFADDARVGV